MRLFNDQEQAFIERNKCLLISELHAKFVETFGRSDVTAKRIQVLKSNKGWKTGRASRFPKGHLSEANWKKGHRPIHTKDIGYEYINDRYTIITINDGGIRRRVTKHRWLWEKKHGPIPVGHVLKCKGDPSVTDPSNWEMVPNGVLSRLNKRNYESAPEELKPTIMAVAKLETAVCNSRRTAKPKA